MGGGDMQAFGKIPFEQDWSRSRGPNVMKDRQGVQAPQPADRHRRPRGLQSCAVSLFANVPTLLSRLKTGSSSLRVDFVTPGGEYAGGRSPSGGLHGGGESARCRPALSHCFPSECLTDSGLVCPRGRVCGSGATLFPPLPHSEKPSSSCPISGNEANSIADFLIRMGGVGAGRPS